MLSWRSLPRTWWRRWPGGWRGRSSAGWSPGRSSRGRGRSSGAPRHPAVAQGASLASPEGTLP
eukprot:11295638-Alexandrium_andersonii.AAC.1